MKNLLRTIAAGALALLAGGLLLLVVGCEKEPPPSLYDPDYVSGAQPVITSVTPASRGLALVTVLTIDGSNFIPSIDGNIVFFNATPGTILSATANRIVVRAPNVVADTVRIKIAAFGSTLFNDPPYIFKLESASVNFGELAPAEKTYAITLDGQGNAYLSVVVSSLGVEFGSGVKKVAADGVKSDFATIAGGSVTYFTGMKMGPDGNVYGVTNGQFIWQMTGGNTDPIRWLDMGRTDKASDLDFDAAGNLWASGSEKEIYRILPNKARRVFPFFSTAPRVLARSVRIYNGYLYIGGLVDTVEAVWRMPMASADSLGPVEKYFDLTDYGKPAKYQVNAVTFSQTGDMYVGTTSPGAILIVHPDKSVEGLYPGVPVASTFSLAWGLGADLYQSQYAGTAFSLNKINMLDARSAPYYGRQ